MGDCESLAFADARKSFVWLDVGVRPTLGSVA
jgi:hypothetical protein